MDLKQFPRVGFSGTRYGLTGGQGYVLDSILYVLFDSRGSVELHEGDCIGADEYAATSATSIGYRVVCHPPTNSLLRAHAPHNELLPPLPFLRRNRKIVEDTDILLATPSDDLEVMRSGTWATIRHARKLERPRIVIGPYGNTIECVGVYVSIPPR